MLKNYSFPLILMMILLPLNSYGQDTIEQEIFSALITGEFSEPAYEPMEGNPILIIEETSSHSIGSRLPSLDKFHEMGLSSLDSIALNDFQQKNKKIKYIQKFSIPNINITIIAKKDWDKVMNKGGWRLYHKTYGYTPTVVLSRPGFNEGKTMAFIFYRTQSDKLGGAGFFLILKKTNDKWMVIEKAIAWRS
jgi:hypothetical protein